MKKVFKILASIMMILLLVIAAGIIRSYNWPVVTTQEIRSEKINTSRRICIIGDLHSKHFSTLVSQIKEQKPDLILMAGDIFDVTDTELDPTFKVIEQCTDICDVYFAMGNHELRLADQYPDFLLRLENTGAYLIEESYFDIDDDLRVGGLYQYPFGWDEYSRNTAVSAPQDVQDYLNDFVNTGRFTLFCAHRPDSFYYGDASEIYPIDLVVSSHIHGGQVVIPFIGGLYGGDQGWWPKYVHGYYQKNKINWLITSGLSSSRKPLPRFNNPPEIYMVNLIPD